MAEGLVVGSGSISAPARRGSWQRFANADYVSMTMEFRCNLRCVHCMIEDTMDRLAPETDDKFEELLRHNAEHRRWKGLILTGSEITLRADLPVLARRARQAGFEHVRIQSHGMHLARKGFARELFDAGIDEYFISIAGADSRSHDALTQVPGSFSKALKGMEILDEFDGVALMTNTVVTRRSYHLLPQIVERLAHLRRLQQMEFWVYWPMSETDDKDLLESHEVILPYLRAAIHRARDLGRGVEIKNFPECLLGEDGGALMNTQPQLFIDPSFWPEFMRNGFYQCAHREACASTECLGLGTAYISKFGDEAHLLQPLNSPSSAVRDDGAPLNPL